ncbi:MAG: cytochrome d ubiquinol oxidase subunit II [Acidimicrobiales bacterium]
MSIAEVVAVIMFVAVVAYAIFAGADFGSGIWDLLAGDDRRGAPTRRLIDQAIGPVWEANHVWLIFILVFLWTGFPVPFTALMRSLAIPFWLVGLGVVLRGGGFALRKYSPTLQAARLAGITFAVASLITPFFLGSIAGALASGRVTLDGDTLGLSAALSPTSLVGGVLAVLTCTFLAGVFLAAEAHRLGQIELANEFRLRSIAVGAITGTLALLGVFPLQADAPTLFDGLTGRAAPLIVVSALAGLATLWLLQRRRFRVARLSAVAAVATIVGGWGVAQYPWILVDQVTIDDGAGHRATLIGLLIAASAAAVLVVPPLIYLFSLADSNRVGLAPAKDT